MRDSLPSVDDTVLLLGLKLPVSCSNLFEKKRPLSVKSVKEKCVS